MHWFLQCWMQASICAVPPSLINWAWTPQSRIEPNLPGAFAHLLHFRKTKQNCEHEILQQKCIRGTHSGVWGLCSLGGTYTWALDSDWCPLDEPKMAIERCNDRLQNSGIRSLGQKTSFHPTSQNTAFKWMDVRKGKNRTGCYCQPSFLYWNTWGNEKKIDTPQDRPLCCLLILCWHVFLEPHLERQRWVFIGGVWTVHHKKFNTWCEINQPKSAMWCWKSTKRGWRH